MSDYKDHDLEAVTWNNIRKTVELTGLYMHFLRFHPRTQFICERPAENEVMQFRFSSVSMYMFNGPNICFGLAIRDKVCQEGQEALNHPPELYCLLYRYLFETGNALVIFFSKDQFRISYFCRRSPMKISAK